MHDRFGVDVKQNVQHFVQHGLRSMAEFLTRRNGTWHFVRRVPYEFADFDRRGIVRHSTRIRIEHDRAGRRAARVAERFRGREIQREARADPL